MYFPCSYTGAVYSMKSKLFLSMSLSIAVFLAASQSSADLPANRWIEIGKDAVGARPGSALRYVPDAGIFLLWGFMNADPKLLQEHPLAEMPEYDMVYFDPSAEQWQNHLPKQRESEWRRKLPLSYLPRTYSGITSGSERTVMRGPTSEFEGVPRPDLNLVFDQATYHPGSRSLIYFTGGLTAAYDVIQRRWSDLAPNHVPPPVIGGSLAHDPVRDEIILFGGGHVAEQGSHGRIVGHTGTWAYRFRDRDWHHLSGPEPPPRMNMRLVCDTAQQVLVLFGGDGQSHYLADTWLYDLRSRVWKKSQSTKGPAARAGHFTVYDPQTGWVIIGGGYNRQDLTDMWAYDAKQDLWQRIEGEVPVGFYLSADIAPEKRLIVLTTSTRASGDSTSCNTLYPVRTTYAYRLEKEGIVCSASSIESPQPMAKRAPEELQEGGGSERSRRAAQAKRVADIPFNQWIHLENPGRVAPTRSWGSAAFDSDRSLILYWGGGHCSYGGSDVDAYDIEAHTWRAKESAPEYPQRSWDKGVRLAGVTFQGKPWSDHGRRVYAYDPVGHKMVMVRPIRLTAGYNPEPLRSYPAWSSAAVDALVNRPSSYLRYATWSYDPDTGQWDLLGSAPAGLDTLVTTRHGVMGVNIHWQTRLNDPGYLLPWNMRQPPEDKAIYLFNGALKRWDRLSRGPSPQNLYEMTSLAYDSRRDQVILHGAGEKQNELWVFDLSSRMWLRRKPRVVAPAGEEPPACTREAVYIPGEDAFVIYGPAPEDHAAPAVWVYKPDENTWRLLDIPPVSDIESARRASQNRALVYDPKRDLVLLVLGSGGDAGHTFVYAMRYRHGKARFVEAR